MSSSPADLTESERAVELIRLGAHDAAEAAAINALRVTPDNPDAWCVLAVASARRGEHSEARDQARSALSADAQHEWAFRCLALAELKLGNRATALSVVEAAISSWPDSWIAHGLLAKVLIGVEGQNDRAQLAITRALTLAPDHVWLHGLNNALALSEDRKKDAAAASRRALALEPGNADVLHDLARARFRETPAAMAQSASLFAQAAGLAPHREVPASNVDYIVRLMSEQLYLVSIFLCFLVGAVSTTGSRIATVIAVSVSLMLLVGYLVQFWQHASASVRRRLRVAAVSRDGMVTQYTLELSAIALLIAVPALPHGLAAGLACAGGLLTGLAWGPRTFIPIARLTRRRSRSTFGPLASRQRQTRAKIGLGIREAIASAVCFLIATGLALRPESRLVGVVFAVLLGRVTLKLVERVINWRRVPIPTLTDVGA